MSEWKILRLKKSDIRLDLTEKSNTLGIFGMCKGTRLTLSLGLLLLCLGGCKAGENSSTAGAESGSQSALVSYIDERGVAHFVDSPAKVPEKYRQTADYSPDLAPITKMQFGQSTAGKKKTEGQESSLDAQIIKQFPEYRNARPLPNSEESCYRAIVGKSSCPKIKDYARNLCKKPPAERRNCRISKRGLICPSS